MCDNRDGWLKQEELGVGYVLVYDYTIQRKVETVDTKREENVDELPPLQIIEEKS